VVGYFSLFDLGLGRALTHQIAKRLSSNERERLPCLVWTGILSMLALGCAGGAALALSASWIVSQLEIPEVLRFETVSAFYVLSASIPAVVLATGLRGILEGYRRFDLASVIRVPMGVLTYLAPLAVLPFSTTLPPLVASLLITRVLSCFVYAAACKKVDGSLTEVPSFQWKAVRELASFGSWITVSNLIGPLLLYLGRFMIAAMLSVEAVAYYSTPYDVLANILLIPSVICSVYFPVFVQALSRNSADLVRHYRHATLYNSALVVPVVLVVALVARPALSWWINPNFAEHSFRVAQLLSLGILINSFGHVSQTLVQAAGRPDLTAKLHVLELLAFVPYAWWLILHFGTLGAALAWVIRVSLSTIILTIWARRALRHQWTPEIKVKTRGLR
jgi:O-antigen/teichoic acid export membrane protein